MARGTTLLRLLDLYRAECRLSLNPAHNGQVRDVHVNAIQASQEWLWSDFAWPVLLVERFIEPGVNQRFYSMPDDLDIDRIVSVSIKHDGSYAPLHPGIDDAHYAAYDSEKGETTWPPQRWKISEGEQIELWPVPDQSYVAATQEGRIKLRGIRKLSRLVDDADRADLDDRLIVQFAAANYLASQGADNADMVYKKAMALYARLRGQQTPRRIFDMFGAVTPERRNRVPIAIYNKTT